MTRQVSRPRRILALSLAQHATHLSQTIKDLTGSTPQRPLAGSTHDFPLRTNYYSATVPIWLDEITSPDEWATAFLSEEAAEVLSALGGLMLVFAPSDEARETIARVGDVVQRLGGWEWDGVRLAVGATGPDSDEWYELCAEAGLEFVSLGAVEAGEIGEKMGMDRVREALEANDWESDVQDLPEELDDLDADEGLETALWDGGGRSEEAEVEGVESIMHRLRAVREAGEGLPEEQRKRMAARAVQEAMREL